MFKYLLLIQLIPVFLIASLLTLAGLEADTRYFSYHPAYMAGMYISIGSFIIIILFVIMKHDKLLLWSASIFLLAVYLISFVIYMNPSYRFSNVKFAKEVVFSKHLRGYSPACFNLNVINKGVLNEKGDIFVYFEIYKNLSESKNTCGEMKDFHGPFDKEGPQHVVVNLTTKDIIVLTEDNWNPCFGVAFGECKG